MAIDVKPILEELESRTGLVDSTSSTQELYDLYKTGQSLGGGSNITVYETEDDLPFLLDATPDVGNLAFVKSTSRIYTKTNQGWFASAKGKYQGNVAGYSSGLKSGGISQTIAFSFASNTGSYHIRYPNAPQHGYTLYSQTGASSSAHGYIIGGRASTTTSPSGPLILYSDHISRFPFSTLNSFENQIGNLTTGAEQLMSATDANNSKAYVFGGTTATPPTSVTNRIESIPFSSSINSSDHGDMRIGIADGAGISSEYYGYIVAGFRYDPAPSPGTLAQNFVDRFPYASFTPITSQVNSNPYTPTIGMSSAASQTNGYFMSGQKINVAPAAFTNLYNFSFASDNEQVTSVSQQSQSTSNMSGWSSNTHGYSSSGGPPTGGNGVYTVDRWPFASPISVTDVGDIGPSVYYTHGTSNASNHN